MENTITNYHIFIFSNEHPRTINTPMMARTNYTLVKVQGYKKMERLVKDLRQAGCVITEICTDLGKRIWI